MVTNTSASNGLKTEACLVNGQKVKTNYKCSLNDQIEILIPDPEDTGRCSGRDGFRYLF